VGWDFDNIENWPPFRKQGGNRRIDKKIGLERLDDHQDDDENHQDSRYLIDNSKEFLISGIPVSGEILFTEKPKKKGVSFEDALEQLQKEKETADDHFRDAFAKEESRMQTVEEKFKEALKRKDELEEPIRPLDWD